MEKPKWNCHNPSIRRIHADVVELNKDPSDQYAAQPLEENLFDWHFVVRGPKGTDFEGGVYHGRILLPSAYPFKPPSIMLLTPNGRWEVKSKICLTISTHHPEMWQPAWGIRTILEALISFMNTPGEGAIGALDYSPEERRRLAKDSRSYRHILMPELPELSDVPVNASTTKRYGAEISNVRFVSMETSPCNSDAETSSTSRNDSSVLETSESPPLAKIGLPSTFEIDLEPTVLESFKISSSTAEAANEPSQTVEPAKILLPTAEMSPEGVVDISPVRTTKPAHKRDRLLDFSVLLAIIICAILARKFQVAIQQV